MAEMVGAYAPEAAYELGLAERPKQRRAAPLVMTGIVIGAMAVYFLEPEHGSEHRHQALALLGDGDGAAAQH